jgi:hypothetical protein
MLYRAKLRNVKKVELHVLERDIRVLLSCDAVLITDFLVLDARKEELFTGIEYTQISVASYECPSNGCALRIGGECPVQIEEEEE